MQATTTRSSWVRAAQDPEGDFPIQNLPLGVFARRGEAGPPSIGVAIGDSILDLRRCVERGVLDGLAPEARCALCARSLNDLMTLGRAAWGPVREAATVILGAESRPRPELLCAMAEARMCLPAEIGDYTDFYASIHHASNVGAMLRPENPLLPNYRHLPVGYHGRASSIVVENTPVRRPCGQTRADDAAMPAFGPSRALDYELELGFFVGPGNELGRRITMARAREHILGLVIVNDWSARDVQRWEYQPLGPFCAKNFATTISPWVVTLEALEPYRVEGPARPAGDPPLLEYLRPTEDMGYDITVEVHLSSERMRRQGMEPVLVGRGNFSGMYWTIAQMLVHHTSTGCNLEPGDLIASGTISGPADDARGCLLERTRRGRDPLRLPDGTDRAFLADGDEVTMRAYCRREGAPRIGFGECRGVILPAEEP